MKKRNPQTSQVLVSRVWFVGNNFDFVVRFLAAHTSSSDYSTAVNPIGASTANSIPLESSLVIVLLATGTATSS